MRRHVGALRHVADVAQVALVDHLPVVGLRHAVHLHRLALVDEVEQRRERVAQADAAAAAVADVEDALGLLEERRLVVVLGAAPVDRVARRGLQVAFAGGIDGSAHGNGAAKRLSAAGRHATPVRGAAGSWRRHPANRGFACCGRTPTPDRRPAGGASARVERRRCARRRSNGAQLSRRVDRGPSGSGSRASAPPSPASRTSRRSRRTSRRAPPSPCPGTCRCTRASRPRPRT